MTVDASAFDLSGRVALVTGAARGIGSAIALAFASAGADLALGDRDGSGLAAVATEVAALGRQVSVETLDVRHDEALARWFAAVADAHGHLDVVVNNAGGGFPATFAEVSAKGERALIDENFTSVAHVVRGALPLLPDGPPGGSIINITSIEAHRAGPGYAVYSAMKAAVANLTKSLALELGPRHLRVNCVAPDVIPTPGIGGPLPVTTPLPYAGHADDVAAAALYLAADASRFVTGTTIHVDGGNHAAGGWRRGPDGGFTT